MDSSPLALLYFDVILLDGSRAAAPKGTMSYRTHMGSFRPVGGRSLEARGQRPEARGQRPEAGGQRLRAVMDSGTRALLWFCYDFIDYG